MGEGALFWEVEAGRKSRLGELQARGSEGTAGREGAVGTGGGDSQLFFRSLHSPPFWLDDGLTWIVT